MSLFLSIFCSQNELNINSNPTIKSTIKNKVLVPVNEFNEIAPKLGPRIGFIKGKLKYK